MIRRDRDIGGTRAGGALIVALIATVSMMVLGATFYQLAAATNRQAEAEVDEMRAFHLAEAGMAEAMVSLRAGMTGVVADAATPAYLEDGVVWVDRFDLGGGVSRLVAQGASGSGRAALEATVELDQGNPIFNNVLNSQETLTMNADVMVDSFSSDLGTYASQAVNTMGPITYAGTNGDIKSNKDIVLNANTSVFGDATPGIAGSLTFAPSSYVSGSTAPATEVFAFPTIDFPTTASVGDLTVPDAGSVTIPAGDHAFDLLTVSKSATLVVEGPSEILVADFHAGKDGSLVVDATNGPVTFFVKNTYVHESGFVASPVKGSPMAVAFMIGGTQDIIFPSNTEIHGAYYAPNANIAFTSGNEAWGSFAANRVDMSNLMKFHWDEYLQSHWKIANGGGLKDPLDFLAWRPAVVGAAMKSDRRDPFAILGVAPGNLAPPALSWQ